jgi:ATPase subunit of ABC transporter with duplicated ATPase domains
MSRSAHATACWRAFRGERVRAALACVLHADEAPNLLLLDEPTNTLDVDTIAQLEEALRAYEGALVAVSHGLPCWMLLA